MDWRKLGPWLLVLTGLRTAVLTIGGLSSLAVAAFMWRAEAGYVVLGIELLLLEYLLRPESPDPRRRA